MPRTALTAGLAISVASTIGLLAAPAHAATTATPARHATYKEVPVHAVTPRAGAVNVRSGPGTRYRVVDTLYPGNAGPCSPYLNRDTPCVSTNGWTKIYGFDGARFRVGYVATNLIRVRMVP